MIGSSNHELRIVISGGLRYWSMRWNLALLDFALIALSDSLLLPVECR
jgi:hypothetical protein